MLVAQVFDAVAADGRPFFSPDVPRLVDPELRSQVVGYLGNAAAAGSGHRTDGTWVWPDSLVDHVRLRGVGPSEQLLAHLAAHRHLLPDTVAPAALAEAERAALGPPTPGPPRVAKSYFAGYAEPGRPASHVLRVHADVDGDQEFSLEPDHGWVPSSLRGPGSATLAEPTNVAKSAGTGVLFEEVSESRASELVDELVATWHERRRRSEREADVEPADAGLLLARVFDGESPSGSPWFSPNRRRIADPIRRNRLAAYLEHGRLVLRVAVRVPDPLAPSAGRLVPLHYRTDGVWVWQEALAYYVRKRGVAPELALLCHIEENGLRPSGPVSDEAADRAAVRARSPLPPLPAAEPMTYLASYDYSRPAHLTRAPSGDIRRAETVGPDLRWRSSDLLWRQSKGGEYSLVQIAEEEAIRIIDERCHREFVELSPG